MTDLEILPTLHCINVVVFSRDHCINVVVFSRDHCINVVVSIVFIV